MPNFVFSPEVKKVLQNAEFSDSYVQLNQQLSTKLYKEVNAALESAGGQWNSKAGRHDFAHVNPKQVLLPMVLGEGQGTALAVFTVIGLKPNGDRYCKVFSAKDALDAQEKAEEDVMGGPGGNLLDMDRVLLTAAVIVGAHENVGAQSLIGNVPGF